MTNVQQEELGLKNLTAGTFSGRLIREKASCERWNLEIDFRQKLLVMYALESLNYSHSTLHDCAVLHDVVP